MLTSLVYIPGGRNEDHNDQMSYIAQVGQGSRTGTKKGGVPKQ